MMKRYVVVAALLCASAFLVCQNSNKVKDPIVRVGKVTIGKESFDTFRDKVARIYPSPLPHYFPGQRHPVSFMVECEAIYQYVKSDSLRDKVSASLDWKWKERYFAAALFFDLLGDNLGFTDAELEDYYKKNPETFRATAQNANGQDSSFIPDFNAAKRQAADRLFCDRYKPDSAFIARVSEFDGGDSAAVQNHWIYSARSNPADFYMRRFFFEQTGEVYADSMGQMYDSTGTKPIVSDDIEVIREWVPENRRNMRTEDLVEWLYKWKSFAERAVKLGLTTKPEYKEMLHWAMRVEHASAYLRDAVVQTLGDQTPGPAVINLAEMLVHDQFGRVDNLSRERVMSEVSAIAKTRLSVSVDSAIYAIRQSVRIDWLQDDLKDSKSASPAALIARADTLKDAASDADADPDAAAEALESADSLYRTVATEFAFTAEGQRAMGELAKLLVDKYNSSARKEKYLLSSAIHYYRRAQMLDTDQESLCNSYFMVGFTYDEHLKNLALAEANYKWILRNTPGCALASDAEFMILHLGEPMTSIEEIQGQSLRQGRKVDFEEIELGNDDAPAAAAKAAAKTEDSEDDIL